MHDADLPIVLSVHGGKEHWVRLKWVCDLAHLLARCPDTDWHQVLERARLQGCERMLLVGLGLAASILDAELPEAVSRRLEDDGTARRLIRDRKAALISGRQPTPSVWWPTRFRFQVRERWSDRLRYVARTLFSPKPGHFDMIRLPDGLFGLYYVVRVVHDYLLLPVWLAGKRVAAALRGGSSAVKGPTT